MITNTIVAIQKIIDTCSSLSSKMNIYTYTTISDTRCVSQEEFIAVCKQDKDLLNILQGRS